MKSFRNIALLLATALALPLAPVPARADSGDSTTGAAVTVGLLFVVAGTYALVALRDDVERYSDAGPGAALERAVAKAEASPVVLEAVTAPMALERGGNGDGGTVAGVSAGWRWRF